MGMALFTPSDLSLAMTDLLKRKIPSTGELLPVVGLGTWQTFDVGMFEADRAPLRDVLKAMAESGAKVIDSSPMYGSSEKVVGDLSTSLGLNDKFFMATKVWTRGEEAGTRQMENSFRLLSRSTIDLMQVHNLVDWQTHLKTLTRWKEEGKVRYIGLTHYLDSAHATIENIIATHKIDFIQVNYSLGSRNAENRLLPAAAEHNVAVLINRPFEEGALFNQVKNKSLPTWVSDFDCKSWGQFFLKFILSNPHVTCVIPGTSKVKHLLDNIGAGTGRLPDHVMRKKMIEVLG
jgi:diketogulonate reductase-like aldo/keto reductase